MFHEGLKFSRHNHQNYLILEIQDKVSKKEVEPLKEILEQEILARNLFIAVDFSAATQVSSFALGALLEFWKRFRTKGGELVILNPTVEVRNLLDETRIGAILPIADTIEELAEVPGT